MNKKSVKTLEHIEQLASHVLHVILNFLLCCPDTLPLKNNKGPRNWAKLSYVGLVTLSLTSAAYK